MDYNKKIHKQLVERSQQLTVKESWEKSFNRKSRRGSRII